MTLADQVLVATNGHPPAVDERPGWLREFASTLSVHSQFVFHGNVHDQFVSADGQELTSLPALVWGVLREHGFTCLLTYDQVDGVGVHPERGPDAVPAKEALGRLAGGGGPRTKLDDLRRDISAVVENKDVRCAFVLGHASRIALRAGDLTPDERDFFLFCNKLGARAVRHGGLGAEAPYNPLIWLVENEGDLPTWLRSDNAHLRSIAVPPPDLGDRQRVARLLTTDFAEGAPPDTATAIINRFAREAHGLTLEAMAGVSQLAWERGVAFEQLPENVATYRLGVVENPWRQPHLRRLLHDHQHDLTDRVKGQPQAVAKALDVLKRAVMGLSGAHTGQPTSRPRGVLFFAGPTGVGKTELAKGIAQLVYGDEGALLRLDMSEFSEAHAADRLIGSPPGYVGHEAGGQLTNAMRRQPFRVVLFDEIEKANRLVLDKFLQVLEDGRLTDGRGDTAYFSESILIFTSNLGVPSENTLDLDYDQFEKVVSRRVADHFRTEIRRPELLNRIGDNIVVFNYIDAEAAEAIFARQVANVQALVRREHEITVELPTWIVDRLREHCTDDLTFGGRGIGNQVEALLVNPLARALFDERVQRGAQVRVTALDPTCRPPRLDLFADE